MPTPTATPAISQATRRTCRSSGLATGGAALRQRRDAAELGVRARREHHGLAITRVQLAPENTASGASIRRSAASGSSGRRA